jgi:chromosome segregation ATPase
MKEKIGKCHDCTAPQTEVNILSRHILELQADKGRLTDMVKELEAQVTRAFEVLEGKRKRIAELEAQIEKMKCCENCAWWYKLPNGQRDCAETCENRDNWSLRR